MLRSFIVSLALCWATQAAAFCGFYVAQNDGELYNTASKVVFVRDGYRSRITMASDYTGPTSEFAIFSKAKNEFSTHILLSAFPTNFYNVSFLLWFILGLTLTI